MLSLSSKAQVKIWEQIDKHKAENFNFLLSHNSKLWEDYHYILKQKSRDETKRQVQSWKFKLPEVEVMGYKGIKDEYAHVNNFGLVFQKFSKSPIREHTEFLLKVVGFTCIW